MDAAQQETILSAIVVSSSTHWAGQPISPQERRRAFGALQDFSTNFEGRVPVALSWLSLSSLKVANGSIDCTVAAQLYACEILSNCLNSKSSKYAQWQETDRLRLRQAVTTAAKHQAGAPLSKDALVAAQNNSSSNQSLPLANKLASLLAALMVRDFPQRWTTCIQDLFGALWSETAPLVGNRMCLQVLQLVAEDCTDSDFNAKVRACVDHCLLLFCPKWIVFVSCSFVLTHYYSFVNVLTDRDDIVAQWNAFDMYPCDTTRDNKLYQYYSKTNCRYLPNDGTTF